MGVFFVCDYREYDDDDKEYRCKICNRAIISYSLNNKCCCHTYGYQNCSYYDRWIQNGGKSYYGEIRNPLITGYSIDYVEPPSPTSLPQDPPDPIGDPKPIVSGTRSSSKFDSTLNPFKPPISSREMGGITKFGCLLYLIGMPFILLYMSVTDPNFGIPLFGAVIIGCILTLAFTLKEIVFKKILLSVWGFASAVFLIYEYFVDHYILKLTYSDTDIFFNIVIGPLFCLMHSAIFAWVIYAVLAKRAAKNPDVLPLSKSLKIVLLLLIPLAVSVMYMQFNNRLEEEKQYYAEDEYYSTQVAAKEQGSSGNNENVIQPVIVQNSSSETNSSASSDSNILTLEIVSGDGSSSANTNVQSVNTGSSPDVGIFNIGDHGYVCRTDGVNLRREPNLDSSGVIKVIPYQSAFTVVGGPSVDSNTIWWQVTMDDGSTGWMSEGHDVWNSDYLLCVK